MGFLIFLVVAGIIILFVHIYSQISKLQEKIEQLEWDSAQLSKRFDSFHATEDKLAKDELKKRSAAEPIAQTASPESTLVLSETSVQPIPPSPTIRPARTDIEGEQPKSRTREEWESFIGGKLLNRIGALALIIGLGFFLKYAFDNNWISETVRVLIGVSTGIISLGLAYRTTSKGISNLFARIDRCGYRNSVPVRLCFLQLLCLGASMGGVPLDVNCYCNVAGTRDLL